MKRLTLVVCMFAVAGCDRRPDVREITGPVAFDFAVYFAPDPATDPETSLQKLLAADFPKLEDVMTIRHRWEEIDDYPPPSAEALRYTSHDVSAEQHAAMLQSTRVFVLTFSAGTPRPLTANHMANTIVARLAEATAGFPWDDECRLLYSVAAWREKRVDSWQDDLPDVRGQVNMHAYRDPELVRIITLGMRKFGLPDLVLTDIPSSNSRAAGNLVNALAQYQLETSRSEVGRVRFKFSELRHAPMRSTALENPLEGATGEVRLRLRKTDPEDGDPDNILLALEFPDFPGKTSTERALAAFASTFGSTDEVVQHPSGDEAMREASERARKLFFEREADLRRGFAPNERLLVKTGFNVPGGTEYMWVEVTGWTDDAVTGTLANDSHYDDKLREGIRVTVKLKDVFDFIHYKPDGTEEGNETGKVLEQRQSN